MSGGIEIVARAGTAGVTFIAHLQAAPFPIEDAASVYFDARDTTTGERCHLGPDGPLPETRHFRDDRVLFHLPPGFDPSRPFTVLIFFHGHRSELRRTLLGELALTRQVDDSRHNVVLVAPQLALDAADSHPGKLAEPGGFGRFLDEAAGVLAGAVDGVDRPAVARAPLVVAAFSGGYRAAAFCLEQAAEMGRAVRGAVLLDAFYGEIERFRRWVAGAGRDSFFLGLYGESGRDGGAALAAGLAEAGVPVSDRFPRRLRPGAVHLVPVATAHDRLVVEGPPSRPLAVILRRLSPAAPHLPL
ncbi:MAG TPA: hypothetical protein VF274_09475 [Alphaproteobacteria bacterium]